jgi:hypothetical protein
MNKIRPIPPIRLTATIVTMSLAALSAFEALGQGSTPYNLAPQQPNFYRSDTNAFPLSVGGTYGTVIGKALSYGTNSLKLTLRQDHGLSAFASITASNSTSTACAILPVTFGLDVSPDGTNFTAGSYPGVAPALTCSANLIVAASSTNTYVYWLTNFPVSLLNNLRAVQCTSCTNSYTNGIKVNWLDYSYSGQ